MSPEYAMQGRFSTRSDVFSFGILLLEIVSGKRNASFYQSQLDEDLVGYVSQDHTIIYSRLDAYTGAFGRHADVINMHFDGYWSQAWKLWNEDRALELVDGRIAGSCQTSEALRCIHVGLLCSQEEAAERPTMSQVLLMLGNTTISIPSPLDPVFVGRYPPKEKASRKLQYSAFAMDARSQTEVTSDIEAR